MTSSQAAAPQGLSAEERAKQFRLRRVYIQLRIPRVNADIAALAARRKTMKQSGVEASKEVIEELIYSNQHLVALRKELDALEEERRAAFEGLKELKLQEKEKPLQHDMG